MNDQPVADTSTWQHTTFTWDRGIVARGGIRTRNPASKRSHTHALDRAATGSGPGRVCRQKIVSCPQNAERKDVLTWWMTLSSFFLYKKGKYRNTFTRTHTRASLLMLHTIRQYSKRKIQISHFPCIFPKKKTFFLNCSNTKWQIFKNLTQFGDIR